MMQRRAKTDARLLFEPGMRLLVRRYGLGLLLGHPIFSMCFLISAAWLDVRVLSLASFSRI
jgi:hypothetical protein